VAQTPSKKRWKLLAGAAGALVAAYLLFALTAHVFLIATNWDDYRAYRSIKRGMTEAQVVERLGKPNAAFDKATAPENYYAEGYSFKRREITNRVLIYRNQEPIAYVYLDRDNRVEEVFIGWS
jgi:hypothetical protein